MTATPPAAAVGPTFRPDIEGLRAIAVLAVLAYHARIPGISGGYIGVDVFFVVSGFLISGLILRELQATGTVDLASFYARRARRLLPAALVVIAVTVIASAIVLPPLRVGDVALDGAASALYVGNLRYAAQATDYLQAELDPSPLLHFWSLSVEEQFYLIWPALLLLVAWRRAGPGRPAGNTTVRRVAIAVACVAAASLVLSVVLTPTDAPLAFFILPTRAWELAIGAGLVIGAAHLRRLPPPIATASVLAGLLAIGIGAVAYDLTTPFPGTAAILPVAGAALIIAGGMRTPHGPLSRLLSIAPMRWIGGISYSLYLWHWPLLVLPAAALEAPLPGVVRLALVAAAFVLAAASKRWIEDPIRHGGAARVPTRRALAMAGALSLAVAIGSVGVGAVIAPPTTVASSEDIVLDLPTRVPSTTAPAATEGPDATLGTVATAGPDVTSSSASPSPVLVRPPTVAAPVPGDLVPSLTTVRDDLPIVYADGCHTAHADMPPIQDLDTCVYGDPGAEVTVVVIGDSHAAQWFPGLERLADDHGWRLISITKSACPSIDTDIEIYSQIHKRAYSECPAWMDMTLARIAAERPDLVFITNSRSTRFILGGEAVRSTDRDDLWRTGLAATIRAARASGAAVVVMGDTPDPAGDPPVCLSDHLDDALACATPAAEAIHVARLATERAVATETGATFIDPSDWLCPTDPCPVVIGRLLVFRDGHHMTTPFARALAPYLEPLLPRIER